MESIENTYMLEGKMLEGACCAGPGVGIGGKVQRSQSLVGGDESNSLFF
jgi:hypothetical protein